MIVLWAPSQAPRAGLRLHARMTQLRAKSQNVTMSQSEDENWVQGAATSLADSAPPIPPTVFIVDDDPALRELISKLVRSIGLTVEAFNSAMDFLDAYDQKRSGCLLLDVRMPQMSGLELHRRLKEIGAPLPIIMVTAYGDVSMAVQSLRDGVIDFLEKPARPAELLEAIQKAIKLDADRRGRLASTKAIRDGMARLSAREREVVALLSRGCSSKRIAAELGLSPKTAHTHLTRVRRKLNASSMADLIRICVKERMG